MTNDPIEKDPILMDMPVPIVTPRLVLRPVQPGDGAMLAEAAAETRDGLPPLDVGWGGP